MYLVYPRPHLLMTSVYACPLLLSYALPCVTIVCLFILYLVLQFDYLGLGSGLGWLG